ncbi:leukocyte elastase inhibitor-like isoform X2 [Adelges cooleyi]|uniref:leukocyte elastase inhibitor-like isoform X2 n=1 Tax=Adelges cooleyi TaxID=133065 RepID=UPI00217FB534|nr:leukocyte elastase inhibitor-like isoform X2 [Adelges cooleyi]
MPYGQCKSRLTVLFKVLYVKINIDPRSMTLALNNFEALSLANQGFSLSLYSKLSQQDGNIFYSPISIHIILFMASIGAAAQTFDEILNTLHLTKETNFSEIYKELLNSLKKENSTLNLATGMFVENSYTIKQSYLEKTNEYLNSTIEKLDFKSNPEVQLVYLNNWVESKTNGKIKDLFSKDSINENTALVLANAVHFKCDWLHKFNVAIDEPFYATPTTKVNVKMMSLTKDLLYYHDDQLMYSALELPYKNHNFKMIILLPDANGGLNDLEKNLSKIKLNELTEKMSKYKVNVKLPRFKLEQSFDLQDVLVELGCLSMFSPTEANFSEIYDRSERPLYISKVVHKAFVEVNEEGTEAAAATGMVMYARCMLMEYQHVDFLANHPFIFFIVSNNIEPLFVGRLLNII